MEGGFKMKFAKLTNEYNGARNAGYEMDLSHKIVIDKEVYTEVCASRDANYADRLSDDLYDFDGDAYLGEDGNAYAVLEVCIGAEMKPFCWQRLKKV